MEILGTSLAIAQSQALALKYGFALEITRAEVLRYILKAANLATCYQGFSPCFTRRRAEGAGRAGFLSCAYDVATDWRRENPRWRKIFEQIVRREADRRSADLAMDLFDKDSTKTLSDDGLERGIMAFRFTLMEMGLIEHFDQRTDVSRMGLLLQIVDDVLDYEEDIAAGDLNCITSLNGREYLLALIAEMTDEHVRSLFPRSPLLFSVIKKSRIKAGRLLQKENLQ